MKVRSALVTGLVVGGLFGVGVGVVASLLARRDPGPVVLPPSVPAPSGTEPLLYIDASSIQLHDGSLEIHPPTAPDVPPR